MNLSTALCLQIKLRADKWDGMKVDKIKAVINDTLYVDTHKMKKGILRRLCCKTQTQRDI